jgi:hypothetical protein
MYLLYLIYHSSLYINVFVCLTKFNYIVSSDWLIVYNKSKGMWKETVVALFWVLFRHFPGGTKENNKTAIMIMSAPVEIRTWHLPNRSPKRYR